jgi:hypothetical protein
VIHGSDEEVVRSRWSRATLRVPLAPCVPSLWRNQGKRGAELLLVSLPE